MKKLTNSQPMTSTIKTYMTTEEVLSYFNISANTLRSWRQHGLPVIKVFGSRFYSAESLQEFLSNYETREDVLNGLD